MLYPLAGESFIHKIGYRVSGIGYLARLAIPYSQCPSHYGNVDVAASNPTENARLVFWSSPSAYAMAAVLVSLQSDLLTPVLS